ncbi:MAG TPA: aldose epimerase family protein [Cyclobacteriaceae bacterium]|jgi:aldose 1-epimerase|nr:aldose epimerase family protein [Cyclobacteriaceae bacterium]
MNRLLFIVLLAAVACKPKTDAETSTTTTTSDTTKTMASITKASFGKLPDGQEITLYTVTNKNGVEMKVMNYGAIITSLKTPDKNGVLEDIVLGYDSLAGYLKESPFFGAVVGRYGNRIAKGKFTLEGKEYTLAINNGVNALHGGVKGFDKVFWTIEEATSAEGPSLKLSYFSKDMEEGYPGNLKAEVIYTLTDNNELRLDYTATTDKTTVINLTQHSYFNLTGNAKRDILEHEIMINSDEIVPVDKTLIPTGKLRKVANTPFDFTTAQVIGKGINDKDEQIVLGGGYDHCFVLRDASDSLKLAAVLTEPTSGRKVEVYTTEPGIQFYSGNFLTGSITGKGNVVYARRFGLCLETEHFPDSPNQKQFPSAVLKPGETYKTSTVYKFSVK